MLILACYKLSQTWDKWTSKRKKLFIEVGAPPNNIIYLLQTDQPTKVVKYKADNANKKYCDVTDINIWLSKVQGILS